MASTEMERNDTENSRSAALGEDAADIAHLSPHGQCAAQLLCIRPHNHSPYLLQEHCSTLGASSAPHVAGFDVQRKNASNAVLLRNELLQNFVDQSNILL